MGKYDEASIIPDELRRTHDVYERIGELGIDLGSFEDNVSSLKGRNILYFCLDTPFDPMLRSGSLLGSPWRVGQAAGSPVQSTTLPRPAIGPEASRRVS